MSAEDIMHTINPAAEMFKKPEAPKVPKSSGASDAKKAKFAAARKAALDDKERFGRDEALLLGGDLGNVSTAGRRTSLLGQ